MISVLVLTLDEEVNIVECITSLPDTPFWRGDIHILDSGSSDGTVALARELGARVQIRRFTDYADQRNFGLRLPFRNEWVVMLDADERMMPELAEEIEREVSRCDAGTVMFRVRRRDIFMGRWLRRSSGYPTWFPRVFRRGRVEVQRAINEVYIADGATGALSGHIEHYPFNKGVDWWFDRHRRYALAEARVLVGGDQSGTFRLRYLFTSDPGVRRAAMKRLAYWLPVRPFLMFVYLYVFRLGFLDGRPGYQFACMRMAYEVMIDAQVAYSRRSRFNHDVADRRGVSRSNRVT